MLELDLTAAGYADKVYGCWLGKNAGGTLGAPLEELFGSPEPFDVDWYPELRDGGIPNDDLEMQLVWLLALEQVGPGLRARHLSRYWLDHIGYNFDEYGMAKANLRLGLEPPLSGWHNNWFADCMGCPIRSEIWACVAPGAPHVAARYAYEDAICDHAGGESVYGELFNAAVESAAFLIGDRRQLVDIGLSYVPPDSRTATAVRAAVAAYDDGLDWRAARRRVLAATPHHVAQYSPINLGFQVIGLLYGADLGDAICTTVNCGYDTDSSGATVGAYFGILAGRSGLPVRWIEPLGDDIATNESWGGVRHLAGRVPRTLAQLTDRIRVAAVDVLAAAGVIGTDRVVRTSLGQLYADESITRLWTRSPAVVGHSAPDLQVDVDYGGLPVVASDDRRQLRTTVHNRRPEPIGVRCTLHTPDGWPTVPAQQATIPAAGSRTLTWTVPVPGRAALADSNRLLLQTSPVDRPEPAAVPVVLLGASAYRISGPYPLPASANSLHAAFPPERIVGDVRDSGGRDGVWRELAVAGNSLPLDDAYAEPGVSARSEPVLRAPQSRTEVGTVLYAQTFLHAAAPRPAWLAVDADCPVRFWVNGEEVAAADRSRPVRPCHRGSPDSAGSVKLRAGWNEVLIKLVRAVGAGVPECHLLLSSDDRFRAAVTDLGRTRYPWD